MAVDVGTILTDALSELQVLPFGATVSGPHGETSLRKLNAILDLWNAQPSQRCFRTRLDTFALTPNLSPHTIGPTGATWTLAQRPEKILGANLVLTTADPDISTEIVIRDEDWWKNQPTKALTSALPTDLYPDMTWPNASLYFWPVPTTAYSVELQSRALLAQLAMDDDLDLPPGYQLALTLTLAEHLSAAFRIPLMAKTEQHAREARALVFGANTSAPRISTRDAGVPGGGASAFNYLTRRPG